MLLRKTIRNYKRSLAAEAQPLRDNLCKLEGIVWAA
jgi:hypothetical protein